MQSALYLSSTLLGAAGAWIVGKFGIRFGLIDKPSERSSHELPTPKGGGIGILAAFLFASWLLKIPSAFWLPPALVSLVSLVGDRTEISPKLRLPVHFLAAFGFLFAFDRFRTWTITELMMLVFLSLFIVGTANFYNFMDGINGIAGVTGLVGFGLLGIVALLSNSHTSYPTLAFCISLSCLGFLPFNMPKARVFMGDVGSILLGFVFAEMVVSLAKGIQDVIFLAAFLFPFYADELITMAVRLRDGQNLLRPHRRHIYQLLTNQGSIPHWKVSAAFGLCQLVVGLSVILMRPFGDLASSVLLGVWLGASILASMMIRKRLEVAREAPNVVPSGPANLDAE